MNWAILGGGLAFAVGTWFIGYGLRTNLDKRRALIGFKKQLKPNEQVNAKWRAHMRLSMFLIVLFGSIMTLMCVLPVLVTFMAHYRWYWCLMSPLFVTCFAWFGYGKTIPIPGLSIEL